MYRNKNLARFIKWMTLTLFVFFLFKVFLPRQYFVESRGKEVNTTFWQLPTGSTIGYTHMPPKIKKNSAYPIIYLHGGPGGAISKRVIDDLKPLSSAGFDVYFYDQVGGGSSSRLVNIFEYTVQRHVDDLYEIIKIINSGKVILIGQSWGAILAAAYLSRHPETIDKIIFTGPGPIYPINETEINSPAPDSLMFRSPLYTNRMANESANNIRMKTIAFFATQFGKKLASDKEVDEYAQYLDSKSYKSALCDTSLTLTDRGIGGYYASVMTFRSIQRLEDFREKIRGLDLPVLILKGQCDNQPWGGTNEYLKLFPTHTFVLIPNAGHFINVEQHEAYIEEIEKFLLR